jgi:hypothetical protein
MFSTLYAYVESSKQVQQTCPVVCSDLGSPNGGHGNLALQTHKQRRRVESFQKNRENTVVDRNSPPLVLLPLQEQRNPRSIIVSFVVHSVLGFTEAFRNHRVDVITLRVMFGNVMPPYSCRSMLKQVIYTQCEPKEAFQSVVEEKYFDCLSLVNQRRPTYLTCDFVLEEMAAT